jgi:hypothetical protein
VMERLHFPGRFCDRGMEDIKDIIGTIVRGCAQGGVVVSEVLAAFVARTVRE